MQVANCRLRDDCCAQSHVHFPINPFRAETGEAFPAWKCRPSTNTHTFLPWATVVRGNASDVPASATSGKLSADHVPACTSPFEIPTCRTAESPDTHQRQQQSRHEDGDHGFTLTSTAAPPASMLTSCAACYVNTGSVASSICPNCLGVQV